jgi:hypothetical protein
MTPEQFYHDIEEHGLKIESSRWRHYLWHAVRGGNGCVCHGWGKTPAEAVAECVANIEKVDKR